MKKNSIDAFSGKEAALEKISGGMYTQDTVYTNGSDDCETITEPGESDSHGNVNQGTWNVSDGIEVYQVVTPNPGGGGTVPPTPIRTR